MSAARRRIEDEILPCCGQQVLERLPSTGWRVDCRNPKPCPTEIAMRRLRSPGRWTSFETNAEAVAAWNENVRAVRSGAS